MSMPSEMPSVKANSTWLSGRVGPRIRTVGSIRRRGPTTITVSSAAKKPSWYKSFATVSLWPAPNSVSTS